MSVEKQSRPPKFPLRLFKWFCKPEYHLDVEGDLLELFENRKESQGRRRAQWLLFFDILLLFRPEMIKPISSLFNLKYPIMYRQNFLLSWRLLLRNKGYSLINIGGLALGMAVAMLIALWIRDEMSYDGFHQNSDQIYSVKRHVHSGDHIETRTEVTWNIAEVLKKDYSEVDEVAITSRPTDLIVNTTDGGYREWGVYATPSFFDIFSWNLLQGEQTTMLQNPSSIIISETLAAKYFGPDWKMENGALGKTIQHDIGDLPDFTVTGVFADVPSNSSLQFDFILPMHLYESRNGWLTDWNNSGIQIFVQTNPGVDGEALSNKITDIQNEHIEGFRSDIFLQAYTDHHLYASFKDAIQAGGRIQYVRIFAGIAIFLMLIASINFMNLSTARSMQRAKEIGVRKAVGAERHLLFGQFISESFLLLFIAFILAVGFVFLSLPIFNSLTEKSISIASLGWSSLLLFAGIGILTTLFASIYPALYMSSFNAVQIIRGAFRQTAATARLRQSLVVFQFVMSILLIVGALTVHEQISYIQSKNLGLDRENVLFLRLEGPIADQYNTIKEELLRAPGVAAVSATNSSPLDIRSNTHSVQWPGKDPTAQVSMRILSVNFDFLDVMKMELAAGRDFDAGFGRDSFNYLVNERALKIMNLEQPMGQQLSFWGNTGKIVGVVKDFHSSSLYSEIEPAIIQLRPQWTNWLYLRTEAGRTEEAIASLTEVYDRLNVDYPFEYQFLDESFKETYQSEYTIGKLSYFFTAFALFIACLGLIGLAVYTGQQRLKEISIRKVLGASVGNLIFLLSKNFVLLVLAAFVIASPIAYLFMQDWLGNFAYRTRIGFDIFLFAGSATLLIALLTVGFYAIKVAISNPVKALKSD